MDRDELVRYLDAYLRIQDFPQDPSLNGLQVEGKRTVRKVGAAVDAGEAIFRKALEEEVDFLIVHHGLFWGKPFPIVGHHKRRLETLFQGGSTSTPPTCPWTPTRRWATTSSWPGSSGLWPSRPGTWG